MLVAIVICFIFSLLLVSTGRWIKGKGAILTSLVPMGLFVYFLQFLPLLSKGEVIREYTRWIPSLGVNLNFVIDGLSLLFALMITGIGSLVFIYTTAYLKNHEYLDRFYGYLGVFMGAMLGVVLSDNLITLFLFWELTSISSFFLIGFNNEKEDSRKSAVMALAITGLGGLLLLVGVILLGQIGNTYTISELISQKNFIQENPLYIGIVWLIFGAAFTKSAQFPFHFWLPGAMKAPTPVSTYLHSATMVKAGIYLLLRLTSVLGDNPIWNNPLIIIGAITMLYAAVHSLFRTDLKAILAYTTIAALGILTFLIGIGTDTALLAAIVFILIHATYKATLFLITGIIDHETGTRNSTRLSGLAKVLMPVAIIAFVAALSHGGFPITFGFIGKDLIYDATLKQPNGLLLTIISVVTNVLLLYAGFIAGIKPFIGKLPSEYQHLHLPNVAMWLPPALLAILCIVFGVFPFIIEDSLIKPTLAMLGKNTDIHLQLWHGFNEVLLCSGITLAIGLVLFFFLKPSEAKQQLIEKFEKFSPQHITEQFGKLFERVSHYWSRVLQNGYLTVYVKNTILVATIILGYSLWNNFSYRIDPQSFSEITFHEIVVLIVLFVAIIFATLTQSRLAAVASLGLLSFGMCMIFMMYSAPDLAMTQFSIDTLTVVLFVLILYKLPNYLKMNTQKIKLLDGILALSFGAVITIMCLEVLTTPQNTEVSSFYAQNSYIQAHGKNIVNVILVDFRGADTMMEISVLSIAAIGVFGLIKLRLKTKERFKA